MRKHLLIKTMLLLCALVAGSESVWADDITFDFEENSAHRTSGNNSYGSNSYSENGVTISLTYADAVVTGTPLDGDANVLGRVAKSTTNSPIVLIGPIDISNRRITDISYKTKGLSEMNMNVDYSLDNTTWNSLQTITGMPTSSTDKSIPSLDITGTNFYLRFTVSVSSTTKSNRDFQLDDIVITHEASSTDPAISLSDTSLDFGEVEATGSKEMTFTITPSNLTADLALSTNNAKYTVSPTSIAANATGAQTITVTASPTSVNDIMAGKVVISGDDFDSDTEVSLSTTVIRKDAELAFDPTSVSLTEGDAFSSPTFTKATGINNSQITFTSSYEDVATVSNAGVIALGTSTGTAIIKATFAQNDVFNAGEATCKIVVNPAGVTPEPSADSYYEKVTSTTGLVDGATYLIVNTEAEVAMGAISGSYMSAEDVTFTNEKITDKGDAVDVILESSGSNWKLKIGNKYYTTTAAKSMSLGDDGTAASITFDDDGNVVIDFGTTPGTLQYNSNNPRFLNYTSSQKEIQLYKYVVGSNPTSIDIYVSAAGLATYASNYDLDFEGVSGLEAYIATDDSGIKLTKKDVIPAGTGMLLRATDGGGKTYEVSTTTASDSQKSAVSGNLFKRGNDEAVASTESGNKYNYILNVVNNKVGFYKANGQTVAKNRAYLQTSTSSARIDLNYENEETGISALHNSQGIMNNEVYDLQGRHVKQPAKGMYVVNGKKLIVK